MGYPQNIRRGVSAKYNGKYWGIYPDGQGPGNGNGNGELQFTPWVLVDAENAVLGQQWEGSGADQWTGDATNTVADATHVFTGTKSFKMSVQHGAYHDQGQFGAWGGTKLLPAALVKGDTIHIQFSLFLPTTFSWVANPWLKLIRIRTTDASGDNEGYVDLYIHNTTIPVDTATPLDGGIGFHDEVAGTVHCLYSHPPAWSSEPLDPMHDNPDARIEKGVWETFEFKVTLDDVAKDDGGLGEVQIFRALGGQIQGEKRVGAVMTQIGHITRDNTLLHATSRADAIYQFTYWNSGGDEDGTYPDQAQSCWYDRLVVENDQSKLVEFDASGTIKVIGGLL